MDSNFKQVKKSTKHLNDGLEFELSEEYKLMIDAMLEEENTGQAEYVSLEEIKNRFYKH